MSDLRSLRSSEFDTLLQVPLPNPGAPEINELMNVARARPSSPSSPQSPPEIHIEPISSASQAITATVDSSETNSGTVAKMRTVSNNNRSGSRVGGSADSATVAGRSASLRTLENLTSLRLNDDRGGTRYRVLGELGRGGMGCVLRAIDDDLRREVALKQIHPDCLQSAEHIARFLREARITGRLEHPGIVPIYEVGLRKVNDQVSLYYTMKLVKGQTLKAAILDFHAAGKSQPLDFRSEEGRRLLDAFVSACLAVAFAHSRGVIHRDLKPDNVMLGDFGETVLLDWGLAKVLSHDVELAEPEHDPRLAQLEQSGHDQLHEDPTQYGRTEFGAVMGTPQYLAPEQAAGRRDLLDKQTDVYSLGVVLYQLLSGQLPFGNAKPEEVLRLVQERDPLPPRVLRSDIPAPLEAVCLKALARNRSQRYDSAAELAQEIRRWIADQPVRAWPEPWHVGVRRWINGHRTLVACAVVAVALNLLRLVWLWGEGQLEQRRERREAMVAAQRFDQASAAPMGWELSSWACHRRALARLRSGSVDPAVLEAAVDDLSRACQAEPENPLPQMALAVAQHRLGRTDEATLTARDADTRLRSVRKKGVLLPETLKAEQSYQLFREVPSFAEWAESWMQTGASP